MSWPVSSITRPLDTSTARDAVLAALLGALALFVLYALFLDQGGLLAPFLGLDAFASNYLHEFAHDGRHLFGLPCH
jgi:hypothetical protein